MSRRLAFGSGIALLAILAAGWWLRNAGAPEKVFEVVDAPAPLAPMCPWRNPEEDLKQLFPEASGYEQETRVLSGLRTELAQRLGRTPTGEENALQIYRILRGTDLVGEVTTRRVKGTFGAIELVLAVDLQGRLTGLKLQRMREPAAIAKAVQSVSWRQKLEGKDADSSWDRGALLADLPPEALNSAKAIVEGVRSTLILLEESGRNPGRVLAQTHNH